MAQSLPYPVHYMPQHTQYYIAPHPQHPHVPGQMHLVGPTTVRTEQPQRKRPKYTRSKTGCLTCRMKKIKCDEAKPSCQRCTHGQRECTWPENLPAKKKVPSRKSSAADERPSPVESSSHVSDASCASRELPTHAHDVAVHDSMTNGIERRHSEPLLHSFSISPTSGRRKTLANIAPDHSPHVRSPNMLGPVPEMASSSYPSPSSSSYSVDLNNSVVHSRNNSRPSTANSLPPSRFHSNGTETGHYSSAPLLTSLDPIEPYVSMPLYRTSRYLPSDPARIYQFHAPHERNMVGEHISHDSRRLH